jgi:hypothetical protein
MGIPLIFSAFFTIITGILSTICFVKNNISTKEKTKFLILKIILSYIVILDVIVSIIEFISIKRKS